MKSVVITITGLEESLQAARRCINSTKKFNTSVFPAFTPKDNPDVMLKDDGVNLSGFNQQTGREYSYEMSAIAAFCSHYHLWKNCVLHNEEHQIFEHDAVAYGDIPEFINYDKCISLGEPSYGNYSTPNNLGVNVLTSKPYFPGAHAYRIKPAGAKLLIEKAKTAACPTDVFLNLKNFPWLQEFYPWPVKAKDSFTTIQRELGCRAKHNWNGGTGFRIIQ